MGTHTCALHLHFPSDGSHTCRGIYGGSEAGKAKNVHNWGKKLQGLCLPPKTSTVHPQMGRSDAKDFYVDLLSGEVAEKVDLV